MGFLAKLLAAALALFALFRLLRSARTKRRNPGWLPPELRGARLVAVEQDLTSRDPPLAGRPDQVYRLPDGRYVPLEYKTRERFVLHETDAAQLSLEGFLLRRNGFPTAPFGVIAVKRRGGGETRAVKLKLADDSRCMDWILRYRDLVRRRAEPEAADDGRCKRCGHAGRCGSGLYSRRRRGSIPPKWKPGIMRRSTRAE
ncbi:PD-(D/E)XK nuclease family protein [Methylococcus capsulatus]|uniref:PD-(D/E)XK nuclease family protein n=1 Tax=Methylococcus capsulatus TaxID=414 RepID=UPI001C531F69|nr:PD-(D/E)XK nuclease family protein [Methylococcus capsulatus]QXP89498.1 PD-(D/E)XK nuclease family protein [Methylococcus capsulatus]